SRASTNTNPPTSELASQNLASEQLGASRSCFGAQDDTGNREPRSPYSLHQTAFLRASERRGLRVARSLRCSRGDRAGPRRQRLSSWLQSRKPGSIVHP